MGRRSLRFSYLRFSTYEVECLGKLGSWRKAETSIKSLVDSSDGHKEDRMHGLVSSVVERSGWMKGMAKVFSGGLGTMKGYTGWSVWYVLQWGRPRKWWIDLLTKYLKRRGLDLEQTRRKVHDRNE